MTVKPLPIHDRQRSRNEALIGRSYYMRQEVTSQVLPFRLSLSEEGLTADWVAAYEALQIEAARTAIRSLASLAEINELDHLGGALDLIPALLMTLAVTDSEAVDYTIENAHTSIGYYSALAALGFLDANVVIREFRRGLDIAGHVSWVPGGTQLNGGRLGVMIPSAVGQALGKKAIYGADRAWVICHCGDAGWISGQALNGFNGAHLHKAPVTFVMHRNGIQLSGSTRQIMDKDPRGIIAAMGVEILETASLHDAPGLYAAYREARRLAAGGRPSLIYPTGRQGVALREFAETHGIVSEAEAFASKHKVSLETKVWAPGALMCYRDVGPMLECLFLVNGLPGGAGHHDGHMKGRDAQAVLANPMLSFQPRHDEALRRLRAAPRRTVVTRARPAPGSPNLVLPPEALEGASLPEPGKSVSPRAGVEVAYALVAKHHPGRFFNVSCDLDPSTKLGKAAQIAGAGHVFEMSIEEQASALMANGLAVASHGPQLSVFATFAAFFEGIAREGFEMWRYQRNLTGVNEGLNVTYHLSHVGACTGRDHFSGWSLNWINLALDYLPYLDRFYAPADARAAFIAVKDLAARYGGHIIGVPRDNLPVLTGPDGGALWNPGDAWQPVTAFRTNKGAKRAILALGAPAFLAEKAAAQLTASRVAVDVWVINGLPLPESFLRETLSRYSKGVVTIEDGLIGDAASGVRGFAGIVASAARDTKTPVAHVGIVDPRIAPAEGHLEVWDHFGLTAEALVEAVESL